MKLRQIGVVRSEYKDRKQVPRLGGPGAVEVFPAFLDGLHRIEKHSHYWVLAWMDQADRDVLQVTPRGVADRGPEGLHGVFSVRSPARPNPIGMTLARVVRVERPSIHFDRLDFVDGTPIIDLKPYFVSRDAVCAATNQQIGRPQDRDALRESLLMQALNFHGEPHADLDLAVDVLTDFRADVLGMVEPAGLIVTAPLDRPVLVDALTGMTHATLGRGTLRFGPPRWIRFEHEGGRTEYELTGPAAFRRMTDTGI